MSSHRTFYLPTLIAGLAPLPAQAETAPPPPASSVTAPVDIDAAVEKGERLVRRGEYTAAIKVLTEDMATPAACYWRGRALLALERPVEAVAALSKVPAGHPLYPFAAKGIIYCAWKDAHIDFVSTVRPLLSSPDPAISAMATAAVAEFELRHTNSGDTSVFYTLRGMSTGKADAAPMLALLTIEELRTQGKYDEAAQAAKNIYEDLSLSKTMRHRALLALAEVYYSMGDDGLGEETLLQFIAANPDTDPRILDEAFRRLATHRAFATSKYTAEYLYNWSNETDKTHRAALALLMRQRAALLGNDKNANLSVLATSAASIPNDAAARTVIMEYIRILLTQNRWKEAASYLCYLSGPDDPRSQFYRAACMPWGQADTLAAYMACLENAPSDFLPAVAANAFYNAYLCGDLEAQQRLLDMELPTDARRAMLLMLASLTQVSDPPRAERALEKLKELKPTPRQDAEAILIKTSISVPSDPAGTLQILQSIENSGILDSWTEEQKLRLYLLELEAEDSKPHADPYAGIAQARRILQNAKSDLVRTEFTFNLSWRLSDIGRHEEAYNLLKQLALREKDEETKARALLLAAEEASKQGSMDYFDKALELFEQCARIPSPYQARAIAHQASVLMWTNRSAEALQLLKGLMAMEDNLTLEDRTLLYTVLADTYAMQGTPVSRELALQASAAVLDMPGISPAWQARAHLQHASLCSRYGMHKEALADYLHVLETNPGTRRRMNKAEWFLLNYAGAGAVYEHMQLGQRQEAAALADQLADWLSLCPPGTIDKLDLSKKAFSSWAEEIRRTIPAGQ